ncbi:hypothetical protein GCM10011338_30360 [Alteromonas lipolytica]|uniref:Uncharacterized protein n=2 Tax=Alteromonas lipolytica TaxID=1856405 RepID=A0A1E8FHL6_9ALTE|nr:hypothetical protein BFC17_11670 [Alteromonas lipolytica]GGF76138.1 hypothetical protein GCM10011338_30360 [Alteromonas lipolytica]
MPGISMLSDKANPEYVTVEQSGTGAGWEERVASNWTFFNIPASLGKVLVIDYGPTPSGTGYRYLANANTQNTLYEPWSSSKIMAFAGALASVGADVNATSMVGDVMMGDLITSINSYAPAGKADGNSNAIATYFANVAGRGYLTGLFHEKWLRMSNPAIRFRGAYGPVAFKPEPSVWQLDSGTQLNVSAFTEAGDDPFYQGYRCDECGLTGNKPMTTLAQAEFLKRLVTHGSEPHTRLPGFRESHLEMLLYGDGHSNSVVDAGGMQAGIGVLLARALAKAIAPGYLESGESAKSVLDKFTAGNWRIFQKIGAGPSETRGQSETVLLAHVVLLPEDEPPREFTLAVQTEVAGDSEAGVGRAGKKMQQVLDISMAQLLSAKSSE